jgi:prepilin-type N-terminal cleavage/methylation domain-containing protein
LKSKREPQGFSLIEVLIALILLAVSLLGVSALMAKATRNTSNGGHLTEAATFAQDRLEGLKVIPYANLASGADTRTSSTGINYTRVLTVVPNGDDSLRTVTVTVNWSDGTKKNHSISMLTVMKNPTSGV